MTSHRLSIGLPLILCLLCFGCRGEAPVLGGIEGAKEAQEIASVQVSQLEPDSEITSQVLPEDWYLTKQATDALASGTASDPTCDQLEGYVDRRTYPGFLSGEPVDTLVYLPPCYDPYLKVYPVLFLLHGKPQDERHWSILGVEDIVTQGIFEQGWPEVILVMPEQPEPLFSNTDGGPGSLEQEFMQGLIPFVLDRYAISGEGEHWAIAGISRGGVWALELGLRHPLTFQAVAALSPSLNVNHARPAYDPVLIVKTVEQFPTRVFLGAGETDSARTKTLELAGALEEQDVNVLYLEVPGTHESSTWIQLLPEMFTFLLSSK
jgi:enterochelin esterase-like enzyme